MFAGAQIAPRFLTPTFMGYVLENQNPGPTHIKLDVIAYGNSTTTLTYGFDQTECNSLYVIEGVFDGQHKCKFVVPHCIFLLTPLLYLLMVHSSLHLTLVWKQMVSFK